MIRKANFHTHTTFCDGADSPEDMLRAALAAGMEALGFSGHSYGAYDEPYCMSRRGTALYRTEIARLRRKYAGQIRVFCGVEQDFFAELPPEDYDYVIGSVHYVRRGDVYAPVDMSRESLKACVDRLWDGDYYAFAADYYALVGALPERMHPDLIGHFDLVTKYNEGPDGFALFDEGDSRYVRAAERALEAIVRADIPFEINTGAVARGCRRTPYPSRPMLERIRDLGGRFVYSSDCHRKEDVDFGFEAVRSLAGRLHLRLVDFRPGREEGAPCTASIS